MVGYLVKVTLVVCSCPSSAMQPVLKCLLSCWGFSALDVGYLLTVTPALHDCCSSTEQQAWGICSQSPHYIAGALQH